MGKAGGILDTTAGAAVFVAGYQMQAAMTGATLAPRLSASGASLRLKNHEGKTPKRRTAVEQALDIWPVLVECATNAGSHADEAKISYGDLALSIGYPRRKAARAVGRALQLVGWYCIEHDAPALNSLVVKQGTQEIGKSVVLHDGMTPAQERENVVSFAWTNVQPPTASALQVIDAEH